MIILDKPYVSDFLEKTLFENQVPVLKTDETGSLNLNSGLNFYSEEKFIEHVKNHSSIYTNSENSIDWITKKLTFSDLPEKINLFKNKIRFRNLLQSAYPDFFFMEADYNNLDIIDISEIKKPFIIKPYIGFFSLGVYKITNQDDWKLFVAYVHNEREKSGKLYPEVVINTSKFIIEQHITGQEFAIDAYFNNDGDPVILNILKHLFPSENNTEDRVYTSSKEIIEEYHDQFYSSLKKIGDVTKLKNFPLHAEFRISSTKEILPIEVNPMRFAGICVTDIAYYAYGINTYNYFFKQMKPNWEKILKGKEGKTYNLVLASVPRHIKTESIKSFNYDKFIAYFKKPLEFRKLDYKKNNIFCILFTETESNNWQEIEYILNSDLDEFIHFV